MEDIIAITLDDGTRFSIKSVESIMDEAEYYDSVIYDLAPQPTGKKGRPAKHGKHLFSDCDFTLLDKKVGEYYIGVRRVQDACFLASFSPIKCRCSVRGRRSRH